MSIEGSLKILLGLETAGSKKPDQMMFGEGAGKMVGLGQWSRREEVKAGAGQ